ncbi:helix-turn-helix domain-containing protein [Streptomyces sp. NPDC051664]|uniref:helix-turn-helix domain-containing protein n=1 Tax=Streptomyces sp. NPDC051664 TaxID=3365668 RepID=UPI00379D9882
MRCSPKTVRRWPHRFDRSGLDGLEDLGGQGRKRRITEAERSQIIGLVRQPAPGRLTVGRTANWPPRMSPGRRSGPSMHWPLRPGGWVLRLASVVTTCVIKCGHPANGSSQVSLKWTLWPRQPDPCFIPYRESTS